MNPAFEALAQRLLGALCNGGYQGLLVAFAVALGLRCWGKASAATRYAVEFGTLLVVALLPVLHFLLADEAPRTPPRPAVSPIHFAPDDGPSAMARTWKAPSPFSTGAASGERPLLDARGRIRLALGLTPFRPATFSSMPVRPGDSRRQRAAHSSYYTDGRLGPKPDFQVTAQSPEGDRTAAGHAPVGLSEDFEAARAGIVVTPGVGTAGTRYAASQLSRFNPLPVPRWKAPIPATITVGLVGVWLVVALARLGRLMYQLTVLWRLKRESVPATGRLSGLFHALRHEIVPRRSPALRISPDLNSPVAAGFWRPAVLIPTTLAEASPAECESILRHELAHLRRRDDWTNLLQQCVHAVFFFHPSVWWLGRRLTLDREIACDDHVLAAMAAPKEEYALLLANLASRARCRDWAAAPAAWTFPSQLKQRIDMILDMKRNASPRVARAGTGILGTVAIVIAVLGLQAAPRLAIADDAPAASPPTPGPVVVATTSPAPGSGLTTAIVALPPDQPAGGVAYAVAGSKSEDSDDAPLATPRPKRKDRSAEPSTKPVPATLPAPPAPAAGVTIVAPLPHVAPEPVAAATPRTRSPRVIVKAEADGPDGDTLERRLDRLERQVESLVRREKGERAKLEKEKEKEKEKGEKGEMALKDKASEEKEHAKVAEKMAREHQKMSADSAAAGMKRMELALQTMPDQQALAEHLKQVSREVAREVERAVEQAAKAVAEAQAMAQAHASQAQNGENRPEDLKALRRSLNEKRQAVKSQLGAVEKQLERLSRQMEKIDERFDRAEEALDAAADGRGKGKPEPRSADQKEAR